MDKDKLSTIYDEIEKSGKATNALCSQLLGALKVKDRDLVEELMDEITNIIDCYQDIIVLIWAERKDILIKHIEEVKENASELHNNSKN